MKKVFVILMLLFSCVVSVTNQANQVSSEYSYHGNNFDDDDDYIGIVQS